jgi:hypothetical protein
MYKALFAGVNRNDIKFALLATIEAFADFYIPAHGISAKFIPRGDKLL